MQEGNFELSEKLLLFFLMKEIHLRAQSTPLKEKQGRKMLREGKKGGREEGHGDE